MTPFPDNQSKSRCYLFLQLKKGSDKRKLRNIIQNKRMTMKIFLYSNQEMQNFIAEKSAFKVMRQPQYSINFSLIEIHLMNLISSSKELQLKSVQLGEKIHPISKLIYQCLTALFVSSEETSFPMQGLTEFIFSIQIPISLLKHLFILINSKFFVSEEDQKYLQQVSKSILFDPIFFHLFKAGVALQQPTINLKTLNEFYSNLENPTADKIWNNIYFIHGGGFKTIQKNTFFNNVKSIISTIGKVYTSEKNLISHNFITIKKKSALNSMIQNIMKIICNYQNLEYIENEISILTQSIFSSKESLTKEQFIENMSKVKVQVLFHIFFDVLKIEASLIESSDFKRDIEKNEAPCSTNFYTQEMQKLLKKCPFNGDERCKCKKCNCVRRNRESAKLSQEKKRHAVEQLGPMQKRIEVLEKRNEQLEQQNHILKKIIGDLKKSPEMRTYLESALQPMSKVLNNQ